VPSRGQADPTAGVAIGVLWFLGDLILASGIKLAAQWEKAVVFRLGKFTGIKGPGFFFIIPIVEQARFIDTRVLTLDIPAQQVITKDNVPVRINGVLFFQVDRPADAIIKVQDYRYAIFQYSQTSLRDVIGQTTLDQLLMEREEIGEAIKANVVKDTEEWGLEVKGIRIQDIDMPEELKKMMSRQASAERPCSRGSPHGADHVHSAFPCFPWRTLPPSDFPSTDATYSVPAVGRCGVLRPRSWVGTLAVHGPVRHLSSVSASRSGAGALLRVLRRVARPRRPATRRRAGCDPAGSRLWGSSRCRVGC
jgi:hypothetical protein